MVQMSLSPAASDAATHVIEPVAAAAVLDSTTSEYFAPRVPPAMRSSSFCSARNVSCALAVFSRRFAIAAGGMPGSVTVNVNTEPAMVHYLAQKLLTMSEILSHALGLV